MQAFNNQGAVSCRHLPHEHFCHPLHGTDYISKTSVWFSTTILLDAAAARVAHGAVSQREVTLRPLHSAGSLPHRDSSPYPL
jgi:hypothetical protein